MNNADFPAWLENAMREQVVVRMNYSKPLPFKSNGRGGVVVIEAMTYQTTSFFTLSRYTASEPLTAHCSGAELETKWFVCAADLLACRLKQWTDHPRWFESRQVVITEGFGPEQVVKKRELGWRELSRVCLLLGQLRERFGQGPEMMNRFATHEKRLAGLAQECLNRLQQACQLLAD